MFHAYTNGRPVVGDYFRVYTYNLCTFEKYLMKSGLSSRADGVTVSRGNKTSKVIAFADMSGFFFFFSRTLMIKVHVVIQPGTATVYIIY